MPLIWQNMILIIQKYVESKSELTLFVAEQKLDVDSGRRVCEASKGSLKVLIDQENQKRVIEAISDVTGFK